MKVKWCRTITPTHELLDDFIAMIALAAAATFLAPEGAKNARTTMCVLDDGQLRVFGVCDRLEQAS
jgi:uncharacterized protein YjeT (DUF2065 family)